MRNRTGYVRKDDKKGIWIARICYKNTNGKRTSVQRSAATKTEANQLLKGLLDNLEKGGRRVLDVEKLTVNDLCDYYVSHYVQEPRYISDRKISGLRSHRAVSGYVEVFRQFLGGRKLKSILYDDLRAFRAKRLSTPTHQSSQRSIGTVNRELTYLRRIFTVAERMEWIDKNPFRCGDSLIHASDETKRDRTLTTEETQRLLDACTGRRSHLRSIIIAALDTGCRLGELLKLQWKDVDFENAVITLHAFNTKTMRSRDAGLTLRLRNELSEILTSTSPAKNDLVFGVKDIRGAFRSARREAGITNFRFHDLRHCHASKLDELGFSIPEIASQLGHTQIQTTMRYMNRNKAGIQKVALALDSVL